MTESNEARDPELMRLLDEAKKAIKTATTDANTAAADALLVKQKTAIADYVKDQRDITALVNAATSLPEVEQLLEDNLLKAQVVAALQAMGENYSAVQLRDGKPIFIRKLIDKAKAAAATA